MSTKSVITTIIVLVVLAGLLIWLVDLPGGEDNTANVNEAVGNDINVTNGAGPGDTSSTTPSGIDANNNGVDDAFEGNFQDKG